ncbi:MAG: MFS transporter, partial [Clostridia bacterium]|nr:MFS transporter [Clostridia bacterium]
MKKSIRAYIPMYGFYTLFFIYLGTSSFQSRYFSEIGMTDTQIGLISSLPAIAALAAQPVWGMLSDRVKYKRTILLAGSAAAGLALIATGFLTGFLPVLIGMTVITVSLICITPTANSIAMEYSKNLMGPLRMTGTIGYQIGAVALGFILTASLRGLMQIMGAILLLCALLSCFEPPIKGHQYGREKVSYIAVFQNK